MLAGFIISISLLQTFNLLQNRLVLCIIYAYQFIPIDFIIERIK